MLLAANLSRSQHWRIALFVIGLVGTSAILGVMQFSSTNFDNPLINTVPGAVAGNFADHQSHFRTVSRIWMRSEFGLDLALRFQAVESRRYIWAAAIFLLTVLASGSRAGMLLFIITVRLQVWRHMIARRNS